MIIVCINLNKNINNNHYIHGYGYQFFKDQRTNKLKLKVFSTCTTSDLVNTSVNTCFNTLKKLKNNKQLKPNIVYIKIKFF